VTHSREAADSQATVNEPHGTGAEAQADEMQGVPAERRSSTVASHPVL